MSFSPRPYQQEALDALNRDICEREGNPVIVIPTGGGKSAMIAWTIRKWKEEAPWFRCCVLQHRKELLEQNIEELQALYPGSDVGIFSAALKQRDFDTSILYASIDSIYKHSGDFAPWDVIFIDEVHRVPFSGEGKFRTWIKGCQRFNKNLKIIGWTATPFRMAGGQICHKDHILNFISYEAKVTDLIRDGYLCQLRSKVGVTQPVLKDVKRNSGGDYIINSLEEATNQDKVVSSAVAEAVRILNIENRHAIIFFTVSIDHCRKVSFELRRHGICAPFVTGKTSQFERDQIVKNFKAGKLRAICNVNVYTEGFNAEHVDCIVLLRPTLSAGLYSQMVGRGLRCHPSIKDCLVLDFASCIEEHGPVDLLGGALAVMAVCQRCRESFSRAIRACPACGWEIPKREIERLEETEKKRRMHGDRASKRSILSSEPETYKVDAVYVNRHRKEGSPDSLRVQYRCGLSMFREWICLDHDGPAGQIAQVWWEKRFGIREKRPMTVDDALGWLFLTQELLECTKTITVRREGKYNRIVDYNQPLEIENDS